MPFRLKRFCVHDERSTMKVGTDAIALGSWAACPGATRMLDVGTGCGLIALMLAQRYPTAMVDAVEPDADSAAEASRNFAASPWPQRLQVTPGSIQQFEPGQPYDLIVCNPPFFSTGPVSPKSRRAAARHDITLTWEELIAATDRLLSATGQLCVVLPVQSEQAATEKAASGGLYVRRCCRLRGQPKSPIRRVLLQFQREPCVCRCEELTIEYKRHEYTPDWAALTAGFLLNTPDPT